ncbi:hypothetical protein BVC80_1751g144 [Macleaya cordata]|uniref:Uncharacterized protein n=1 Tax=Macleaya cordata TaxID=56857 RepID=A0A200QHW2_MACCD|nr:hypothetical protein BVC80_1751g144 [Macleaya cordata]
MGSVCISNCVDDARVPVRATYVNLYKWPESDAEFVRSVSTNNRNKKGENRGSDYNCPRVVDSISCRQMYLRSYTFSVKKESIPQKTKKCLGRVKDRVVNGRMNKRKVHVNNGRRRKCTVMRKVKELSCAALFSFFRRLLLCSSSVDVVDRRDHL